MNHEFVVCEGWTGSFTYQFEHVVEFLDFLIFYNYLLSNRQLRKDFVGSNRIIGGDFNVVRRISQFLLNFISLICDLISWFERQLGIRILRIIFIVFVVWIFRRAHFANYLLVRIFFDVFLWSLPVFCFLLVYIFIKSHHLEFKSLSIPFLLLGSTDIF